MARLMRYLTLPAPKRRRTEKTTRTKNGEVKEGSGSSRPTNNESGYVDELCSMGDHGLERSCMRLVLLAENEGRVLFDSASIYPTSGGDIDGAKKSPDGQYQFLRRRDDTYELGHMLFGTMAAAGGTASVKIHTLGDNKMLVSRVFTMPIGSSRNEETRNDQSDSVASSCGSEYGGLLTVHSLDGLSHYVKKVASSCIPPEKFSLTRHHRRSRQSSLQTTIGMDDSDAPSTCSTDYEDLRALSPPHRVFSRTRRDEALPRNSLQDDQNTLMGLRSRFSSMSAETEVRTVGMGVILEANERHFVLQHMPLIESELRRLESRVQVASANRSSFIHHIYEAWSSFCTCLCTLHNSARLRDPVWIHLLRKPRDSLTTARFCALLAETSAVCETKQTKFFLSNVITAILMHHMAWIASVAPPPVKRTVDEKMGTETLSFPSSLSISSLHGVNPHVAQLLEISGCVGGASRSARTVVCGSDGALISKILHCLSYFLRCTSIAHRDEDESHSHQHLDSSHNSDSSIGNESMIGEDVYGEGPSTSCSPSSSVSLSSHDHQSGLGESLLAGPSYSYSPHFVLSGLLRSHDSRYNNYLMKISDEMSSYADSSLASARQEMCPSSPTPDNVTIVADCTEWTVKVLVGDGITELHSPAESIVQMMETFSGLHREGVSPHVLTDIMEDTLSDLLSKSIALTEILQLEGPIGRYSSMSSMTSERVSAVVGCDHSDLRLLLNIAAVYCPTILSTLNESEDDDRDSDV